MINIIMLDKRYGYYTSALSKTSEPIRNTKWLVEFNFSEFKSSSSYPNADTLSFHVKNVDIPSVQSSLDSFFYHGFERKLPTSVDNAGSISMTMLEGEDLIGYNSLLRWQQACANAGQLSTGAASIMGNELNSEYPMNSPDYSVGEFVNNNAVTIKCFSYASGAEVLKVNFLNIKPTKIGVVKLAYDGNELYRYDVTYDYDLAVFVKPGLTKNRFNIQSQSTYPDSGLGAGVVIPRRSEF